MSNLKYSRQRETIRRHLEERCDHPTAEMIYTSLKEEDPRLSLGTVYRNLGLLVQMGQVRRLRAEDGPDRYDARTEQHGHFICTACGAVEDFEAQEAVTLLHRTMLEEGRTDRNMDITVYGLCPDCSGKE